MSALVVHDEAGSIAEFAALKREMVSAVTKAIDWYVSTMGLSPAEANARARSLGAERVEMETSNQVTYSGLSGLMEMDPDRSMAVWQRMKDEAEAELMRGMTAARSVEVGGQPSPLDRAKYLAIVNSLKKSLQPRDALETMLIQQIAIAYDRFLKWQTVATNREAADSWDAITDRERHLNSMSKRDRERWQDDNGWLPPRVSRAEAIDQAVMIADRYQRSFLRLLKALRDQRRLVGTVVMNGGQLNVGEQQVITRQAPNRPKRGRRTIETKGATS